MLGIVILNYKTYDETIRCIENILSVKIVELYKIYIVDNDSPNESYNILCDRFCTYSNIKVIQSGENGGFSYGNNIGFRAAIGDGCDKILCTNNDVEFKNDAISIMCEDLNAHSECAVIGPKVLCSDGDIQNGNRRYLTVKRFIMRHKPFSFFDWFGIEKKYTYSSYRYDKPIYIEGMVSGCCFLMRSSVIQQVGYLDDNIFLYHEENILAAKLKRVGYKVLLDPSAEIIHYGGKTTGSNSAFLRYHSFYSVLYYFWHYTKVSKISFNIVGMFIKSMFFIKSFKNIEYKNYYKRLKIDIRNLKRSNRNFGDEHVKTGK